jgi:hypothetical protein
LSEHCAPPITRGWNESDPGLANVLDGAKDRLAPLLAYRVATNAAEQPDIVMHRHVLVFDLIAFGFGMGPLLAAVVARTLHCGRNYALRPEPYKSAPVSLRQRLRAAIAQETALIKFHKIK